MTNVCMYYGVVCCLISVVIAQQYDPNTAHQQQQQYNPNNVQQQQYNPNNVQQQQQYDPNVAQQQHQQHQQGQFGGQNEVHNQDHIKQHLEGQINVDESKMTDEQLQFHYFKMYDTDHNQMLDGIEIIKAITHFHGEEAASGDGASPMPKFSEKELEDMIDPILNDEDSNGDGYIDYAEFARSQAKTRTPPPSPPPVQ